MTAYLRACWFLLATIGCALFLALAVQNVIADVAAKTWRPLW